MSLLAHRLGTANRLQILTSLAYLAVEAENSGDLSLANYLRNTFAHSLRPHSSGDGLALNHTDTKASLDFLIRFLSSTPSLQASIISLLERGEAGAHASA